MSPEQSKNSQPNVLVRLELIKEKRFEKRTPKELNQIIPQIQLLAQEWMDSLRPFKKGGCPWHMARYAARDAARDAGWYAALDAGRAVVWAAAQDAVRDAGWDAGWDAAQAMVWETIKDKSGFENNPFLHLLKLYELGMVRLDFREVDGEEQVVLDFPLEVNGRSVLGCLVFSDGKPGDQEVLYFHYWGEPHSDIKPLTPQRKIS